MDVQPTRTALDGAWLRAYLAGMPSTDLLRCLGLLRTRALASFDLGLTLLCLVCGCDDGGSSSTQLDGGTFLLESSQGFEPVADTTVRLSFDDGELHFSAGCNSHSGAYTLRDGRLIVSSFEATEIGCDAALHAQDMWLAEFLSSSPLLALGGDRLTLTGDEATLIFLDREVADPDRPLVMTLWTIDTFIEGDSASSIPLTSDPTLLFGEDGSLELDTTCNTGSGHYAVAGDQITLTNVAYTDKACSGASASADAHIQSVMSDGTLTFEIEAARLTVLRRDLGLSATGP